MDTMKTDKVRENFSRRRADRLGLMLKKSRGKRWSVDNQLGYMLVDFNNFIEAGEKFDLTIEQIETLLEKREKQIKEEQ